MRLACIRDSLFARLDLLRAPLESSIVLFSHSLVSVNFAATVALYERRGASDGRGSPG